MVPLATAAAVIGIRWVAIGEGPEPGLSRMAGVPDIGWIGVAMVVLVVNGFGEELGWRGFAWSRLREDRSLPQAALLLAIPWALWHAPTFWIDTGLSDVSLPLLPGFFIGLAAGAVVLGWLYERTGSVVVVAVWHTALNMASATKATAVAAPFVSAVVITWAIAIVRRSATLDDQDGGISRRRRSERPRRNDAAVPRREDASRGLASDATASRPPRRRPRRHDEHAALQRAPRSRQSPQDGGGHAERRVGDDLERPSRKT
jgi:membrane protease YdiL (CAAX protease family)